MRRTPLGKRKKIKSSGECPGPWALLRHADLAAREEISVRRDIGFNIGDMDGGKEPSHQPRQALSIRTGPWNPWLYVGCHEEGE